MSSIFPMVQPAAASSSSGELPLYREIAWDYVKNIPKFHAGEPVVVTGVDAVKVWAWKALNTVRYKHEIYSWDYGSDLERLVGQAYTPALKEAEAPRYLQECLLTNPYILAVRNISVSFEGCRLTMAGTLITIYGEVALDAAIE